MKIKDLKSGSKFKYAGQEFTKLADEENSCYCLMNASAFESEFGKTNDWAKSPIREQLNKFDENGNSEAINGIKTSDLVSVGLNYYAYKVPNGRTEDLITLLSWEEVYAYDFENIDEDSWLRSGGAGDAHSAYSLTSSGAMGSPWTSCSLAVRPALHLKAELEVEVVE